MKTKIISLLVLLAFAVVSCQKDDNDKLVLSQDVEFGIIQVNPNNLKDGHDWNFECDLDKIPATAHIEIDGIVDPFTPQVFYLNGELYTQAIKLAPGTYTVTKFLLKDAQGDILMATPEVDSEFAPYVSDPVEFEFAVGEFTKIEVEVEVLCFEENQADGFGFFWFEIERIVIREQCFFGDLCIKSKTDYEGSYYDDLFDLDLYPFDLPALFKVKLERADGLVIEAMNFEIDDDGKAINYTAPLCIKYPDRVGIADEYTLTLYVLVAQGDGWEFVEFKSLEFTDYYIDEFVDEGEVIDFVVGYCNYNPNEDWVFPAWINLPETAMIQVQQNWNWLYWRLDVQSNTPSSNNYDILNQGLYTSWCGDGAITLTGGTYNFHIYNTLYYDKWNLMPNATEEKMSQVHWLINNIGNFSGFNPFTGLIIPSGTLSTTQAQIVQDAIWTIINGPGAANVPFNFDAINTTEGQLAATMASQATSNGSNFKPMPGQWSSILVIRDDNPGSHQLIFTVVDP